MKLSISARCKLIISLPVWLALATVADSQQTNTDWHAVTDSAGHFSIMMPGDPEHKTQKDESHKEGPIVTDTYVLSAQPNLFIAAMTQYPAAIALPDQDELTADRDNFNKEVKATVVSEERKTFGGFPAVDFKSKNEQMTFHSLMVKADHNVYCAVAAYKIGDEPADCGRFINSLKLIKP